MIYSYGHNRAVVVERSRASSELIWTSGNKKIKINSEIQARDNVNILKERETTLIEEKCLKAEKD